MLKRFHRRIGKATGEHSNAAARPFHYVEQLEERLLLSAVSDVRLFYNDSAFDGYNAAITIDDDAAIATDKQALLELNQASFNNYSSYYKGINGVMVDLKDANNPTLDDFIFRRSVGNGVGGEPIAWEETAALTGFQVRPGEGLNGTDRIVFTWNDASAVKNGWLQITVKTGSRTGLLQRETFYFGSAIGETGDTSGSTRVNGSDYLLARRNLHSLVNPAGVDDAYDINRDKKVDGSDLSLIRRSFTNYQTDVPFIVAPLNKATHLHAETFSSTEAYLRWHDQSFVEGGYRLTAYNEQGEVLFTQDTVADASAMLIEGLAAGVTYRFSIAPTAPDGSAEPLANVEDVISVTTPEQLTSGSTGSTWYVVTLIDTTPTRGAAGSTYTSGTLSLDFNATDVIDIGSGKALVKADSGEAAVFKAVTGSTTIKLAQSIDPNEPTNTFNFDTSGAYDVGQVSSLKTQHSGWGDPNPYSVPYSSDNDQWLIVIENLRERSGVSSDEDFDDFVWAVGVEEVQVGVELSDVCCEDEKFIDETSSGPLLLYYDQDKWPTLELNLEAVVSQDYVLDVLQWVIAEDGSTTPIAGGSFVSGTTAQLSVTPTSGNQLYNIAVGYDLNGNGDLDPDEAEYILQLDAREFTWSPPVLGAYTLGKQNPGTPNPGDDAEPYVVNQLGRFESKFSSHDWYSLMSFDDLVGTLTAATNNASFSAEFENVENPEWQYVLNDMNVPLNGLTVAEAFHEIVHARNDFADQFDGASEDEGVAYTLQGIVNLFVKRLAAFEDTFDLAMQMSDVSERRIAFTYVGELWTEVWERARTIEVFGNWVVYGNQSRQNTDADMANLETATGLDLSATSYATHLNQVYSAAFANSCFQMVFLSTVANPTLNKVCADGELLIEAGLQNALPSSIQ